jgi:hypothetical protein
MAKAAAVERVRPGAAVVSWAHRCLVVVAIGAWSGGLSYALGLSSAGVVFLLSIPLYLLAHWRLFVAVSRDTVLGYEEKAKIRGNLLWFGPAAVLQLLVRIHLPTSGFGG